MHGVQAILLLEHRFQVLLELCNLRVLRAPILKRLFDLRLGVCEPMLQLPLLLFRLSQSLDHQLLRIWHLIQSGVCRFQLRLHDSKHLGQLLDFELEVFVLRLPLQKPLGELQGLADSRVGRRDRGRHFKTSYRGVLRGIQARLQGALRGAKDAGVHLQLKVVIQGRADVLIALKPQRLELPLEHQRLLPEHLDLCTRSSQVDALRLESHAQLRSFEGAHLLPRLRLRCALLGVAQSFLQIPAHVLHLRAQFLAAEPPVIPLPLILGIQLLEGGSLSLRRVSHGLLGDLGAGLCLRAHATYFFLQSSIVVCLRVPLILHELLHRLAPPPLEASLLVFQLQGLRLRSVRPHLRLLQAPLQVVLVDAQIQDLLLKVVALRSAVAEAFGERRDALGLFLAGPLKSHDLLLQHLVSCRELVKAALFVLDNLDMTFGVFHALAQAVHLRSRRLELQLEPILAGVG
eukprot:scaffold91_cov254-Pinguiococcus_pyrenoidosus.AAC.13